MLQLHFNSREVSEPLKRKLVRIFEVNNGKNLAGIKQGPLIP
jgi:hypothetical protein